MLTAMAKSGNVVSFRRRPLRPKPTRWSGPPRRGPRHSPPWFGLAVRLFGMLALVPVPAFVTGEVLDIYLSATRSAAEAGGCRITRVVDGDTVSLYCAGYGFDKGRLRGLDAPELFSPACLSELWAAEQAKWALRTALFSADEVRVLGSGRDRYDRRLVTVLVDGRDVAKLLVAAGHGRPYQGEQRREWC